MLIDPSINNHIEEEKLPEIQMRSRNELCFDCSKPEPTFASVNNGIYICGDCAEVHKALGLGVSLVRPLPESLWSEAEQEYLRQSGNDALYAYFDSYALNSVDILSKYKSEAAKYYRERLEALVTGDQEKTAQLIAQGQPSPYLLNDSQIQIRDELVATSKKEKAKRLTLLILRKLLNAAKIIVGAVDKQMDKSEKLVRFRESSFKKAQALSTSAKQRLSTIIPQKKTFADQQV